MRRAQQGSVRDGRDQIGHEETGPSPLEELDRLGSEPLELDPARGALHRDAVASGIRLEPDAHLRPVHEHDELGDPRSPNGDTAV